MMETDDPIIELLEPAVIVSDRIKRLIGPDIIAIVAFILLLESMRMLWRELLSRIGFDRNRRTYRSNGE